MDGAEQITQRKWRYSRTANSSILGAWMTPGERMEATENVMDRTTQAKGGVSRLAGLHHVAGADARYCATS